MTKKVIKKSIISLLAFTAANQVSAQDNVQNRIIPSAVETAPRQTQDKPKNFCARPSAVQQSDPQLQPKLPTKKLNGSGGPRANIRCGLGDPY